MAKRRQTPKQRAASIRNLRKARAVKRSGGGLGRVHRRQVRLLMRDLGFTRTEAIKVSRAFMKNARAIGHVY